MSKLDEFLSEVIKSGQGTYLCLGERGLQNIVIQAVHDLDRSLLICQNQNRIHFGNVTIKFLMSNIHEMPENIGTLTGIYFHDDEE